MNCPYCKKRVGKNHFACQSGAEGGKVKGPTKARTSEQARAAVNARWAKAARANGQKGGRPVKKAL